MPTAEQMERIQKLRLMDDIFLTKCFEGAPECAELVLQILMSKPDLKVLDVRTQVFVENLLNRSVRLDILAMDSVGTHYNIEVQRSDKGAGRRRARYNSSMMDASLLEKGADFDSLPETFVIFITENDVMGQGEALYEVERCFTKTGVRFEDGSHILYVNGAFRGETPVGKLMHDFSCSDAASMNYDILANRVRFFKEENEGVLKMCEIMEEMCLQSFNEGKLEGKMEGILEGKMETMKDTALRMLRSGGYSLDIISTISGLSLDEVKSLDISN